METITKDTILHFFLIFYSLFRVNGHQAFQLSISLPVFEKSLALSLNALTLVIFM